MAIPLVILRPGYFESSTISDVLGSYSLMMLFSEPGASLLIVGTGWTGVCSFDALAAITAFFLPASPRFARARIFCAVGSIPGRPRFPVLCYIMGIHEFNSERKHSIIGKTTCLLRSPTFRIHLWIKLVLLEGMERCMPKRRGHSSMSDITRHFLKATSNE